MDLFIKVIAGIVIAAILSLILSKQGAEISLLLTICVCCMVVLAALSCLHPVLNFAYRLAQVGQFTNELLNILLKVVGIGLLSQIAGNICNDAGNQSLGKSMQIVTTAIILYISLPMLEEVLSLVETVLGEI